MKNMGEWILHNKFYVIIAAILVVAFLVSRFCFQIILVSGVSMEPTYKDREVVIIDKRKKTPTYGEVIVFREKNSNRFLIKRVVGCPGDTVSIKDGTLMVSGEASSVYPYRGIFDYAGILEDEVALGDDEYICIGDNIANSIDSRFEEVGVVKQSTIAGTLTDQRQRQ